MANTIFAAKTAQALTNNGIYKLIMGYYYTTSPGNAVPVFAPSTGLRRGKPGKFLVPPKTHTPGSRVEKRGARFYNPEAGRWMSADVINNRVEINRYESAGNAFTMNADVLGAFMILRPPAGRFKCGLVRILMTLGAYGRPWDPWTLALWQHWLAGGGDMRLPDYVFDPNGTIKNSVVTRAIDFTKAATDPSCGQTVDIFAEGTRQEVSPTYGIRNFTLHFFCYVSITKSCLTPCCCSGLKFKYSCEIDYFDKYTFNNGGNFAGIDKALVDECNQMFHWGGADFKETAVSEVSGERNVPCVQSCLR